MLFGRAFLNEEVGNAVCRVVQFEELTQSWLADVKTYQQHFLPQQGERHGQIARIESLSLA